MKNEAQFIGFGLMSVLPYVDEVVYFDGNSTDGTLKLLSHIKQKYDTENKIKVFENKDFTDLKEDYVRLFNECMSKCSGDYLFYLHPDMIITDPGILATPEKMDALAYFVNMRSFAGEDLDIEIIKGRTNKWKTIMKNDFGLHYWGHYGHQDEDMYFRDITGNAHHVFKDMKAYPFAVKDSGIHVQHYCECKPRKRREEKMRKVLETAGVIRPVGPTLGDHIHSFDAVMDHPRVHLQSQKSMYGEFEFVPRKDAPPSIFSEKKDEFEMVLK